MSSDLPWLGLRPELLAGGYDDAGIRRSRKSGELAPLRRGAYVRPSDRKLDSPLVRHALLIEACGAALERDAVISHCSAAVLHGLELWSVPLARAHFTRAQRTGGRIGRTLHLHTAPLPEGDVVDLAGLPVTSLARTVLDLARMCSFESGVVAADSALRAGLEPEQLRDTAARLRGWRGAVTARRVALFADGRSESAGESRSRVAMLRVGLPRPELQWNVEYGSAWVARSDFAWPELRTVGEFDGQVKYGRLLGPGRDPGEVAFAERRREDAIREAGFEVVRWRWRDLRDFAATAVRIRTAMVA